MEKKWSTLHVCVKDYRNVLGNNNAFYKQIEELELWNNQKHQHLNYLSSLKTECTSVREVEHINTQIVQTIEEITRINETKVKNLTQYSSTQSINEEELQKLVRTVVDKNVLLVNSSCLIEYLAELIISSPFFSHLSSRGCEPTTKHSNTCLAPTNRMALSNRFLKSGVCSASTIGESR